MLQASENCYCPKTVEEEGEVGGARCSLCFNISPTTVPMIMHVLPSRDGGSERVAVDQFEWHMFFSRSGMEPRRALLCWGHSVVLRSPPGSSLLRDPCSLNSRPTPLSATTALKQPTTLPQRVREASVYRRLAA